MRQAVSGNVDDDGREEACIHAQSDQQTTTLLEMIAEVIARVRRRVKHRQHNIEASTLANLNGKLGQVTAACTEI